MHSWWRPLETATRECEEEIGFVPEYSMIKHEDNEEFNFRTFIVETDTLFVPHLNWEHDRYNWVNPIVFKLVSHAYDMHPGFQETIDKVF